MNTLLPPNRREGRNPHYTSLIIDAYKYAVKMFVAFAIVLLRNCVFRKKSIIYIK